MNPIRHQEKRNMNAETKNTKKAIRAIKEKKWAVAAREYEELLVAEPDSGPEVYANLARCHRMLGATEAAEETTLAGLQRHPSSSRILSEQYWLYRNARLWKNAKVSAEKLVSLYPNRSEYQFRLGSIYTWLKDNERAQKAYYRGLALKHENGIGLENVLAEIQTAIQRHVKIDTGEVKTEFSVLKGKNNIGTFHHEFSNQKFITKVVQNGRISERETFFYQEMLHAEEEFVSVAPQCLDIRIADGLTYITLEKVPGSSGRRKYFDEVLMSTNLLSKVEYSVTEGIPQRTYSVPRTQKSPLALMPYLTNIDDPYTAEELFSWLRYILRYHGYPQSAYDVTDRLAGLLLGHELYRYIHRSRDFIPVHGDLIADNIIIEEQGSPAVFIDWASFTVGPRGLDVARWMSSPSVRLSYQTIRNEYLYSDKDEGAETTMELMMFLVSYILFHLVQTRRSRDTISQDLDERMPEYIIPALEDLEEAAQRFLNDLHLRLQRSQQRFVEDQKHIACLKQEVKKLNKKRSPDSKAINKLKDSTVKLRSEATRMTRQIKTLENHVDDMFPGN